MKNFSKTHFIAIISAVIIFTAVILAVAKTSVFSDDSDLSDQPATEKNSSGDSVDSPSVDQQLLAEHYDMKLKLDTEKNVLSGTVTIDLNNQTEDTLTQICLKNPSVSFLKLEQPLAPRSQTQVQVPCSIKIPRKNDRFGYHKEGGRKTYQLTFCLPTLSMYEQGKWDTHPNKPGREANFSRISDYDIELDAPADYTVVASGTENRSVQGDRAVTCISARSMRDMAIIASNYIAPETIQTEDGVSIRCWNLDYKGFEEYDQFSLEAARDSMHLFSETFGKYPYEELDVVQGFLPDGINGMEYPGLVIISLPDVKNLQKMSAKKIRKQAFFSDLCCTVAHEAAHQWFCVTVGNDPFQEPWLDEGLAEYCEDVLYPQAQTDSLKKAIKTDKKNNPYFSFPSGWNKKEFQNYMEQMVQSYANQLTEGDSNYISKPCSEYGEEAYSFYVYEGGKYFFYELEQALGSKAFLSLLKEYYQKFYLKEATGQEFVALMKQHGAPDSLIERYIGG